MTEKYVFDAKIIPMENDTIILVDIDRYLDDFPDMQIIQLKLMSKTYSLNRKTLVKMIESLEAL